MMYRFIDEHSIEKWDEKYVILDGKQISYPSDDVLLRAGIKPLIEDEMPVYDEDTQYIVEYYEDTDTAIIKHWRVEDIPPIEEVDMNELADA